MSRGSGKFNRLKFEERICFELNTYLRTVLSDPRLNMASITKVELNVDYSVAKAFWDTFDSSQRGDIKKALEQSTGKLRSLLAKNMKVRHIPELNFVYDSQFEDEMKITNLLNREAGDEEES